MSSFVYMRFLESSPERYDLGMRWLSGNRIDSIYHAIAARVAEPGRRILDIGCGTGGVSLACAGRGAHVIAIDSNAGMLEVARRKAAGANIAWRLLGAMEIEDQLAPESLDAVVSCLVFSELLLEEQRYVARTAYRCLRPGGTLVIADEVVPRSAFRALLYRLRRLPLAAVIYLLTQASTRPVRDLAQTVREAGFVGVEEQRRGAAFAIVEGKKA